MPGPSPYPQQQQQQHQSAAPVPLPALYLYPLNDSFIPKHISLTHNQRVKIGRQTNAKTAPGERNGYFDSKVLSRQHAEVWEEASKIYIKDVKSSNGTFINGERLSPEGLESEPAELKSDDIVEFGIDIVGEDNKSIIHHKVAARVVCVFSEQDAQVAARAEQHSQQHSFQSNPSSGPISNMSGGVGGPAINLSASGSQPSSAASSGFFQNTGGANNPASQQQQRRPGQPGSTGPGGPPTGPNGQQLSGTGAMSNMRPPGKSGLSFDHILSRLQAELQKSRETGAELSTIQGAMNDINDTLGGALPSNPPSYPHHLPPVRSQQDSEQPQQQLQHQLQHQQLHSEQSAVPSHPTATTTSEPTTSAAPSATSTSAPSSTNTSPQPPPSELSTTASTSAIAELQSKLLDTEQSLKTHVEKIHQLENILVEQEEIKKEVKVLKEIVVEFGKERLDEDGKTHSRQSTGSIRRRQANSSSSSSSSSSAVPRSGFDDLDEEDRSMGGSISDDEADDEDDARSVNTISGSRRSILGRVDEVDEESENDGAYHEDAVNTHQQDPQEEEHDRKQREEDEEHDREERRELEQAGRRPKTPEPSSFAMGLHDDEDVYEPDSRSRQSGSTSPLLSPGARTRSTTLLAPKRNSPTPFLVALSSSSEGLPLSSSPLSSPPASSSSFSTSSNEPVPAEIIFDQIKSLSMQVSAVVTLTSNQQSLAQETISALNKRIEELEEQVRAGKKTRLPNADLDEDRDPLSLSTSAPPPPPLQSLSSSPLAQQGGQLTSILTEWKKSVEGQWGTMQTEWKEERERLNRARGEWEERVKKMEGNTNPRSATTGATVNGTSDLASKIEELEESVEKLGLGLGKVGKEVQEKIMDVVDEKLRRAATNGSGGDVAALDKLEKQQSKLEKQHKEMHLSFASQQTQAQQYNAQTLQYHAQTQQSHSQTLQCTAQLAVLQTRVDQVQNEQKSQQQQMIGMANLVAALGGSGSVADVGINGGKSKGLIGGASSPLTGLATGGLVTPPSPRGLSLDSNRGGSKVRRRKSGNGGAAAAAVDPKQEEYHQGDEREGKRGRTGSRAAKGPNGVKEEVQSSPSPSRPRSRSRSLSPDMKYRHHQRYTQRGAGAYVDDDGDELDGDVDVDADTDTDATLASEDHGSLKGKRLDFSSVSSEASMVVSTISDGGPVGDGGGRAQDERSIGNGVNGNSKVIRRVGQNAGGTGMADKNMTISVQTAAGVLILSVAAAAVFWKVGPE